MTATLLEDLFAADVNRVRAALDAGAFVDTADDCGYSPLVRAAIEGHEAIVELLLARGADPNHRDGERMTALIWAAVNKRARIASMLLAHGAKPDLKDAEGNTALDEACLPNLPGALETVRVLVDGGAKIDLVHQGGFTALMSAAIGGLDDVVEFLVGRGANLEHRSTNGFTPLIQAIRGGHPRTVEKLLDLGADPSTDRQRLADAVLEITAYIAGGNYDRDAYDFEGVLETLRQRGLTA